MMKIALLLCGLLAALPARACDIERPIVFAGLDWDSVGFHNAVARFILEHGYGCKTDVMPGTTIPLLQGIAQGDVDIAMEIWKDAVTEVWQKALTRGQVVEVGINFPDATQGWYVPRYVVEKNPDLKTVSDLARHKALFADAEEPGKGRFYNCIAGWACEIVNTNKLRAYGLSKDFTNFRPGTGAALSAAVAGAYLRKEPILFYYWAPTWLLGSYDLVALSEPQWNDADWKGLAADPDYPRAVAYPTVEVWIGANKGFAEKAPQVMQFLRQYRTTAAAVSDALAFMQRERADEKAAAKRFLQQNKSLWTGWIDAAAAQKVTAALAH